MEALAKICEQDEKILLATAYKVIDATDPVSQARGVRWWEEMTEKGGEGMKKNSSRYFNTPALFGFIQYFKKFFSDIINCWFDIIKLFLIHVVNRGTCNINKNFSQQVMQF